MSKETDMERVDRLLKETTDEIPDLAGEDLYAKIVQLQTEFDKLKEPCEWGYDDSGEYWKTGCEELFTFLADGPLENNFEFCPYCGKPITLPEKEDE